MSRESGASDLLREICRCPEIPRCLTPGDAPHPCSKIVGLQGKAIEEHQVPEPWSGHLEMAPILFLSSNPSLGSGDTFPRWNWSDDELSDFFVHRFGGGSRDWVKDGRYSLLPDGSHDRKPVAYWAGVRRRAMELLGTRDVRPGLDYALSEVVHCKSKHETGVGDAVDKCAGLYLRRLVAHAGATVVVCLGLEAGKAVRLEWKIPESNAVHGPLLVGQHERYFAFLPHPNAFEPKTFVKCLPSGKLALLRGALGR